MNQNTTQTVETEVPTATVKKPKRALFALRAVGATLILALLLGVIYLAAYRAYPTVAEWIAPGDHSALVYEGETYCLAGVLGKRGLTEKNYPVDKLLGKVHDDGLPTVAPETETEPETDPEETLWLEETEDPADTEPVTKKPEDADPTLARDHAYVLYSVEKKPEYLLLLAEDGKLYVYYREDIDNPINKN